MSTLIPITLILVALLFIAVIAITGKKFLTKYAIKHYLSEEEKTELKNVEENIKNFIEKFSNSGFRSVPRHMSGTIEESVKKKKRLTQKAKDRFWQDKF